MAAFNATDHAFLLEDSHPTIEARKLDGQLSLRIYGKISERQWGDQGHVVAVLSHVARVAAEQGVVFVRLRLRMDGHVLPLQSIPIGAG